MLYEATRKDLFRTVMKLYKQNMIPLSSGNVSFRASEDHIIMTPSGIPYDEMSPDDLVVISVHGATVEGKHRPSSEAPMHVTLYETMPEIFSVVHTHSPYALAFAVAGRDIPVFSMEGIALGGPVPVAKYASPGTKDQGLVAVEAMNGPPVMTGALLRNHGVVAIGATLKDAYETACQIEMAARTYLLAMQIGTPALLTQDQIDEIRAVYAPKKSL
jgi:L-ribulose-5-phosphate 4-epimerase